MQLIDVILAWLVAEDDGAKKKIVGLLADRDEDLSLVKKTLQGRMSFSSAYQANPLEQIEGLVDDEPGQKDLKDILGTLLQFL